MAEQKRPEAKATNLFNAFNIVIGLFWFTLFFLVFPLPNNGTPTVLKTGGLILWVAVLFAYLALLLYRSRKGIFVSLMKNNFIVLGILGVTIITTLAALVPSEALWGNDFTLNTSAFVVILAVIAFFLIKIFNVAAEKDVSKFLKQMPFWLLISDVVSLVLFVIPMDTYRAIAGNYSDYFSYFKQLPLSLHGNILHSLIFHLLAIIIVVWHLAGSLGTKRDSDAKTSSVLTYGVALLALAIFGALVLPVSGDMVFMLIGAAVVYLLFWAYIALRDNNVYAKWFVGLMLVSFIIMGVARLGFNAYKISSDSLYVSLSFQSSMEIVQSSFMNKFTPLWRLLTGWGHAAFSYLYPLYRPLDAVQQYGSDITFYKSSNFWFDVFIEQGLLGLIVWGLLVGNAVYVFFKSQKREQLYMEFSLVFLFIVMSFISFLPSVMLFLMIVIFALMYDKVEILQENLKSVKAMSIQVTDINNNVGNALPHIMLAASIIFGLISVYILAQGGMLHYYILRTSKRLAVAQAASNSNDQTKAAKTLVDAYSEILKATTVCPNCGPVASMRLNTLYSIYAMGSSYPDKVKDLNLDARFLTNQMINDSFMLVNTNPLRSDYWFLAGNVFATLADAQKSSTYADEALLSYNTSLAQNPYNINARYTFIDFLVKLGDDAQTIQLMGQNIDILKSLVGNAIRLQFLEAGYYIKLKQYDNAIKKYQEILDSIDKLGLNDSDKEQLKKFTQEQIDTVKKLQKQAPATTTGTTPTPTVTPTATPTPTPTKTK